MRDESLERGVERGRALTRLGAALVLALVHLPDESSHDIRRAWFERDVREEDREGPEERQRAALRVERDEDCDD